MFAYELLCERGTALERPSNRRDGIIRERPKLEVPLLRDQFDGRAWFDSQMITQRLWNHNLALDGRLGSVHVASHV